MLFNYEMNLVSSSTTRVHKGIMELLHHFDSPNAAETLVYYWTQKETF